MRLPLLLALASLALTSTARAETIETLPMPAAKSVERAMLSNGSKGWLAVSFGANDTYRYTTNGTPAGTVRPTLLGYQRVRYLGFLGSSPFVITRSLAEDSLCRLNAADEANCASPAAVTEPEAPGLFPTAVRYPNVFAAFPVGASAVYTSTGAFTNGMSGGDRKLGHVGLFTEPAATSSVHVLRPGGVTSPTQATMLGVAGGKPLFQRSDEPTKVYVVDGTTVTSRATTSALDYVASPLGSPRVLATGGGKLLGVTATSDEVLGDVTGVMAKHMFGARVALLVNVAAGVGLWITDGTAAGTTKWSLAASSGQQLLATSDRLFAATHDGTKATVWTTNGTAAPTAVTTLAAGELATLLGARGATAYFGVIASDFASTKIYATTGASPVLIGSVMGRVDVFRSVADIVDRTPTVGDAVVAFSLGVGLVFVRGEGSPDAGAADAAVDAKTDGTVAVDSATDSTVGVDTAVEDTTAPMDTATSEDTAIAVEDTAATAPTQPADPESSGCGCRVANARGASPFALALLVLALRATRRPRAPTSRRHVNVTE